jgi:iron complex outermembrane receptor protein
LARNWVLTLWAAASAALPASAAGVQLADLSLEELGNIEITSISRRAERLADAPGSVYVITADAIRRSGATSLPQALRLAPNLQVAQIDASQFAITARGFNNAIGNKLLVLVDGRTVYTSFFSGVFWDQQDLMMADIDRIEVISGPGATLWGTNAVNGIINVVTRAAQATQGTLLTVEGGGREANLSLRHGGELGVAGRYRLYAKRSERQNTTSESGAAVSDGWNSEMAGFRGDWGEAQRRLTLQGDAYRGHGEARIVPGVGRSALEVSGWNVLGRWEQQLDAGSELRVQAYIDHMKRDDALLYQPEVTTTDLELQHGVNWSDHKLVWGAGYRRARDEIRSGLFFGFHPASRVLHWASLFVQDELALGSELNLTLGARLERNDYTGTESLPSLRLAWKPGGEQLLWTAVSRAVRAPARLDRDISLPPNPPYLIAGGPEFVSELATVTELGWRAAPWPELSVSVTAFRYAWDRLRSGQPPPNARVQNMIDGRTHGLEAWMLWQPSPSWRLTVALTSLHESLRIKPGSTDPVGPSALGNDPDGQWFMRLAFNPASGHELDLAVRRVSALPDPAVPAYTALDLRYGWQLSRSVNLALSGQNLLDRRHAEFGSAPGRSELPSSLSLQLRWAL